MKALLIISMLFLSISSSFGQVNRYTQTPAPATYTPMSFDEMYNMAQMRAQSSKVRSEQFNFYQGKAHSTFNSKNYKFTITHCNSALATNLENNYIYFLRGMSYLNLGFKKEGKKDLKKSAKMGNVDSKLALQALKK